ncbi:hypothetical protein L210DRAFT_3526026 [Boletus edulis BED1]|uniref:Uncharacterized protein n=1 Tax=Boletus edulis BED1 TaxID=1328754 RepID=A0AAD4GJ98_BOLED|nr:hypothetical protein L210DRAFT_3526026 [Boletus edulis BED1]
MGARQVAAMIGRACVVFIPYVRVMAMNLEAAYAESREKGCEDNAAVYPCGNMAALHPYIVSQSSPTSTSKQDAEAKSGVSGTVSMTEWMTGGTRQREVQDSRVGRRAMAEAEANGYEP